MTKSTFGLSERSLQEILAILRRNSRIEKAIIYGSRAMGTFKEGSDIDLTLVGSKLTTSDLLKTNVELDDSNIPYQVDLSIFHQILDRDLLAHIEQSGKVFYQRD